MRNDKEQLISEFHTIIEWLEPNLINNTKFQNIESWIRNIKGYKLNEYLLLYKQTNKIIKKAYDEKSIALILDHLKNLQENETRYLFSKKVETIPFPFEPRSFLIGVLVGLLAKMYSDFQLDEKPTSSDKNTHSNSISAIILILKGSLQIEPLTSLDHLAIEGNIEFLEEKVSQIFMSDNFEPIKEELTPYLSNEIASDWEDQVFYTCISYQFDGNAGLSSYFEGSRPIFLEVSNFLSSASISGRFKPVKYISNKNYKLLPDSFLKHLSYV